MIEIRAEKCALCGWEPSVGFNGDDFARNIKRARCSNPECEQHFRIRPIPTVIEWNKLQREIAEGESR